MSFFIEDILKNPYKRKICASALDSYRMDRKSSDSSDWSEDSDESGVKKRRILFTRQQTWQLEKHFQIRPYMSGPERDALANKINLTPTQIKIWFQNHRYKMKKYMKDMCEKAQFEKQEAYNYKLSPQPILFYNKILNEGKPLYDKCKKVDVNEHRDLYRQHYTASSRSPLSVETNFDETHQLHSFKNYKNRQLTSKTYRREFDEHNSCQCSR